MSELLILLYKQFEKARNKLQLRLLTVENVKKSMETIANKCIETASARCEKYIEKFNAY